MYSGDSVHDTGISIPLDKHHSGENAGEMGMHVLYWEAREIRLGKSWSFIACSPEIARVLWEWGQLLPKDFMTPSRLHLSQVIKTT